MSRLSQIKNSALALATNLRSWKTSRKIVVFESDDWGAIRMRDKATHGSLVRAGIPVDQWRYDSLDCLESSADLIALMELLDRHQDSEGRPPKLTMNMVMGNPDFEAIRKNEFERFFFRSFLDSYQYYNNEDMTNIWAEGVDRGLFKPQFHAREHLNSYLWLKDLRAGHAQARIAFDHDYYGLITATSAPPQRNYLAAYWPTDLQHLSYIYEAIDDGLKKFEAQFGFRSSTFIACNYVWPRELEPFLFKKGIRHLQGQRGQVCPEEARKWSPRRIGRFTGQYNQRGQSYGVRNVQFEPFSSPNEDWCLRAMKQISQAFSCGTSAIISTHRVNYVSGLRSDVRDKALLELSNLISLVKQRWPQVEFLSSDQLSNQIADS